ncbi:hypothetical protein Slin14017_G118670 [Septoria linicola]|nr:hypothetical protein Slin14017_G118670 [Septoria linicola]
MRNACERPITTLTHSELFTSTQRWSSRYVQQPGGQPSSLHPAPQLHVDQPSTTGPKSDIGYRAENVEDALDRAGSFQGIELYNEHDDEMYSAEEIPTIEVHLMQLSHQLRHLTEKSDRLGKERDQARAAAVTLGGAYQDSSSILKLYQEYNPKQNSAASSHEEVVEDIKEQHLLKTANERLNARDKKIADLEDESLNLRSRLPDESLPGFPSLIEVLSKVPDNGIKAIDLHKMFRLGLSERDAEFAVLLDQVCNISHGKGNVSWVPKKNLPDLDKLKAEMLSVGVPFGDLPTRSA